MPLICKSTLLKVGEGHGKMSKLHQASTEVGGGKIGGKKKNLTWVSNYPIKSFKAITPQYYLTPIDVKINRQSFYVGPRFREKYLIGITINHHAFYCVTDY